MQETQIQTATTPIEQVDPMLIRRIGFVDLGSNSCRLCVVEYDIQGRMTVLTRVKSMVRLGDGAFETHELQPAAIERTIRCLEDFAEIGRSYGVERIVAVGTAALRMAANRQDFIDAVKAKTGIAIEVISGEEEARLIRVGIFSTLPKTKKTYLFIDIGGGSTEISVSDAQKIRAMESVNVGCVMVSDAVKKSKDGRVSASQFADMMTMVETKVQHALLRFEKEEFSSAIASSGTALALYRLAALEAQAQNLTPAQTVEGGVLTRRSVESLAKKLAAMSLAERQKLSGMSETRAEVIVGGAAVLLTLMKLFGLKEVIVTDSNLQDGQRVDFQVCHYAQQKPGGFQTRDQHVKLFARRYHYEKTHGRQVRRLAKKLYKSSLEAGLATNDDRLMELLSYAARLHDIGIAISYDEHYRHGAYLVRYSHLLGFTDSELETMARLVFLHSRPSETIPDYLGTKPMTDNEKVAALCLYVAEMLDKTHRCVTESAHWVKDGKSLKLIVYTRQRVDIEMAGEMKIVKHAKRLLGRTVKVEFTEKN